jgi:3-phenylpropionate/trans-cinnamate dioxygenase ferredoxin subunit
MALRVRVCSRMEVQAGRLDAFRVTGVTWPVLVTVVDGEVVAVPGVCPHEDVPLARGTLEKGELTCPGHGYAFDLRDGKCTHDPTLVLRRYPVTIVAGEIYVDLL